MEAYKSVRDRIKKDFTDSSYNSDSSQNRRLRPTPTPQLRSRNPGGTPEISPLNFNHRKIEASQFFLLKATLDFELIEKVT